MPRNKRTRPHPLHDMSAYRAAWLRDVERLLGNNAAGFGDADLLPDNNAAMSSDKEAPTYGIEAMFADKPALSRDVRACHVYRAVMSGRLAPGLNDTPPTLRDLAGRWWNVFAVLRVLLARFCFAWSEWRLTRKGLLHPVLRAAYRKVPFNELFTVVYETYSPPSYFHHRPQRPPRTIEELLHRWIVDQRPPEEIAWMVAILLALARLMAVPPRSVPPGPFALLACPSGGGRGPLGARPPPALFA